MIKGYEHTKDQYVTFSDTELKALDETASQGIEIAEFVPTQAVDPVYFEKTYYLGPDRGGDKPYALLATAMADMKLQAIAKYASRGKDYLVLLRAVSGRLLMQQLYHSDEVRPIGEVPAAERDVRETELKLARQLIEQITSERFEPEKYEDQVRARIRAAIEQKLEGKEIARPTPERQTGKVVDLMAALKASLGAERPQAKPARTAARRTAARTRRPRAGSAHHGHRRAS
jgi:DNA end-binding protein Ku